VLGQVDDFQYASTSKISPRASIGAHLRHVLDFHQCFLDGVESRSIDYNRRRRDPLFETDRVHAREMIAKTSAALRALSLADDNTALQLRIEDAANLRDRLVRASRRDARALNTSAADSDAWCKSSILRELEFLQSHTVHHYSLVAMLLRSYDIEPDEELGVASSTLKYWKEAAACAR